MHQVSGKKCFFTPYARVVQAAAVHLKIKLTQQGAIRTAGESPLVLPIHVTCFNSRIFHYFEGVSPPFPASQYIPPLLVHDVTLGKQLHVVQCRKNKGCEIRRDALVCAVPRKTYTLTLMNAISPEHLVSPPPSPSPPVCGCMNSGVCI